MALVDDILGSVGFSREKIQRAKDQFETKVEKPTGLAALPDPIKLQVNRAVTSFSKDKQFSQPEAQRISEILKRTKRPSPVIKPISRKESDAGRKRASIRREDPTRAAIQDSSLVKLFSDKASPGTKEQLLGDVISKGVNLPFKVLEGAAGGVKAAITGEVPERTKPVSPTQLSKGLTGATQLVSDVEPPSRLDVVSRATKQAFEGGPIFEDEKTDEFFKTVLPIVLTEGFGIAKQLAPKAAEFLQFKNKLVPGADIKVGLQELSTGNKLGATKDGLAVAQKLIDNNSKGNELLRAVREGGTIKEKRAFIKWFQETSGMIPKPKPEIAGLLEEIGKTGLNKIELVDDYVGRALSILKPQPIGERGLTQLAAKTKVPSFVQENVAFAKAPPAKADKELVTQLDDVIKNEKQSVTTKELPVSLDKNIDVKDDVKKVINAEANALAETKEFKAITKPVSKAQIKEDSATLNMDVKMLKQFAAESRKNKAILEKSKQMLAEGAERVVDLVNEFNKGAYKLSDSEKQVLIDQINDARDIYKDIYLSTREIVAESGRTLAANKIISTQINNVIADGDKLTSAEDIAGLGQDFIKNNPAEILNKSFRSDLVDKALEIRNMGLLTNPATHIVNAVSNATNKALSIPDRAFSAAFNAVESTLTGKERDVFFREIKADLVGSIRGVTPGLRKAIDTLLGKTPLDGKFKDITFKKAVKGKTGEVVRIPGRFLQAGDDIFKGIASEAEKASLAVRIATKEKLKGSVYNKRVKELIENPTPKMIKQIDKFAKRAVFQEEVGELTKKISQLRNVESPFGRFIMKTLLPFVATPSNIFKQTFERTPVAPFMKSFKEAFKEGGSKRAAAVGRMATGTSVMAAVALAASTGMITGVGPKGKNERKALMRSGWRPYSIKIGDNYYSYKRLEPIGTILGWTATAVEQWNDDNEGSEKKLGLIAGAFAENAADKTFLTGIKDFSNFIDDPSGVGKRFLPKTASSFQPFSGFSRFLRDLNDKFIRTPQGTWQYFKNQLPGLSDDLPPLRDVWGKPIEKTSTVPGVKTELAKGLDRKVESELFNIQYFPGLPGKTISFWEMDQRRYDLFLKQMGEIRRSVVERLVQNDNYTNLQPQLRRELMEKAIDKISDEFRSQNFPLVIQAQINGVGKVDANQLKLFYDSLRQDPNFDSLPQQIKEDMLRDAAGQQLGVQL